MCRVFLSHVRVTYQLCEGDLSFLVYCKACARHAELDDEDEQEDGHVEKEHHLDRGKGINGLNGAFDSTLEGSAEVASGTVG